MSISGSKHARALSLPKIESSMNVAKRIKENFYQYEPLQNSESDIRILRLVPSNESDEICCCFEMRSLNDKPFYLAASYEWGDPEPQVDIKIDGKRFRIRLNLWLFLHYLQTNKPDLVRSDHFRIWVDAICIDQSNIIEKNAQVQIMSRIFTQADSVFAWLGWTTAFDTKTLFRFVREASFHGQLSIPKSADEIDQWFERFVYNDTDTAHFCHVPLLEVWNGVVQLSSLSYWSRRWIVQEVLFAREVTVLFDGQELPWIALELLFGHLDRQRLRSCQENIRQVLDRLERTIPCRIWRHRAKRAEYGQDRVTSLRSLLKDFGPTVCTIAHDRVYALLNLSTDGHFVNIDYSSTMIDVFAGIVTLGQNNVLSAVGTASLAAELELSSKPVKSHKKNADIVGPFVKYCRELSNLVRVIDVNPDPYPAFEFVAYFETVGEELHRPHARHLRKAWDHLSFDTNLVNSRVEHSLAWNALLKDGTKLTIPKSKGHDDRTTSEQPSTTSESGGGSYIVCDDGSVGWGCSSILPGDFLWAVGQRVFLVLRYHAGIFSIIGAASTMRLGSPMKDLDNVMSSRLHEIETQSPHFSKLRDELAQEIRSELDSKMHAIFEQQRIDRPALTMRLDSSREDMDNMVSHVRKLETQYLSKLRGLPKHESILVLQSYHALMKSLWRGTFNYTWFMPTGSSATPSAELTEAAFVWRSEEGGRVRLFPGNSSQGNSGLKEDDGHERWGKAGFTPKVKPTSSVDVIFDAWELIAFAQQFECLEEV